MLIFLVQMARELDAKLDHGVATRSTNCTAENGSTSFLEQIIGPIYETLAAVSSFLFKYFRVSDNFMNAVTKILFCLNTSNTKCIII